MQIVRQVSSFRVCVQQRTHFPGRLPLCASGRPACPSLLQKMIMCSQVQGVTSLTSAVCAWRSWKQTWSHRSCVCLRSTHGAYSLIIISWVRLMRNMCRDVLCMQVHGVHGAWHALHSPSKEGRAGCWNTGRCGTERPPLSLGLSSMLLG